MTLNELNRPQMTSNDLAKPDTNTEPTVKRTSNRKNKNSLKGGSMHDNVEVDDEYLDEVFHIINP